MNYQGRKRRREEKPRSSRTSLEMQNFNTRDWRGSTCRGVMSAIDWSAVGCLSVRPHWHSLVLRWRERVVSLYADVPGIPRLSGGSLVVFFSPFFLGRNRNRSSGVLAVTRTVDCKCKGDWSPLNSSHMQIRREQFLWKYTPVYPWFFIQNRVKGFMYGSPVLPRSFYW